MMHNDNPHSGPPNHLSWYHPRSLAWLLVELIHLIRVYISEKRQSVQARRWAMAMQIAQGMQSAHFIARDDSLGWGERECALETMRHYRDLAEELGIDGHHQISRYIDEYEELSEGRNV